MDSRLVKPRVRRAGWLLATLVLAGCRPGVPRPQPSSPGLPAATTTADGRVPSNIARADYAGSAACKGCHADLYQAWMGSPMHRMTRLPEPGDLRAPAGTAYHFKNDSAVFEDHGAARLLRVRSSRFGEHLYRLTRVIGGRTREDYAGVEVAGPEPGARVLGDPTAELVLPVSFVFAQGSFRLKGYSVMVAERPGLKAGGVWNRTCIFCHNTEPYLLDVLGALAGPGAPGYQGEVVDALLPPERRFAFEVTDPAGLERALAAELGPLGAELPSGGDRSPARLARAALEKVRARFAAPHLLEVGIGCESCHGGSRAHVRDFNVNPTFEPRSPYLRVRPATGTGPVDRAALINRTCARCHQVLFSRYPFTWEGGTRQQPGAPGGSSINSGEARDFLLGGCAGRLACTSCHDPHALDRPERLAEIQSRAGNALCTRCHDAYAGDEALRAHAHHDPAGPGGVCLACHMPKKNMGLGYTLTRYHRIGSPTDRARVEKDRPLECALCHTDRTVGQLVSAMERFWGKRYDRDALRVLYGAEGALPLEATLARGRAHEQAVAIVRLGEERRTAALRPLAAQLENPYPLLRYYARQALEAVAGRPCPVDLDQDDAEIARQAAKWLGEMGLAHAAQAR